MNLDNHIAKRFLQDDNLEVEILELMFPNLVETIDSIEKGLPFNSVYTQSPDYAVISSADEFKGRVSSIHNLISTEKNHRPFYCTETMIECLELLKINKIGEHYNWTYFDKLKDQKATFIFPNNCLLRMIIEGDMIHFIHVTYKPSDNKSGQMAWVMFYLNRKTGELCEHFGHKDVKNIERFIYSLLCFVYLSDREEVLIAANSRYGTRKGGKLVNTTNFPMTIINSKWNITSIRTEGFLVAPHFAIRHTGPGRNIPRVVFIDQFEKHGYVRKNKPDNL